MEDEFGDIHLDIKLEAEGNIEDIYWKCTGM